MGKTLQYLGSACKMGERLMPRLCIQKSTKVIHHVSDDPTLTPSPDIEPNGMACPGMRVLGWGMIVVWFHLPQVQRQQLGYSEEEKTMKNLNISVWAAIGMKAMVLVVSWKVYDQQVSHGTRGWWSVGAGKLSVICQSGFK